MSSQKLLMRKKHELLTMLSYMRPAYSETESQFAERYLEPVFGNSDKAGNYILSIGKNPNICFTAHYDTVHKFDGKQNVKISNGIISLPEKSDSNCLGADCTTGIWLILEMIKAKISGVYVVHAAEEIGCIGSKALVARNPNWINKLDAVISFDRKGRNSIITHQMGLRTCSEVFATSLGSVLGLGLKADDTGSYTDSNEYSGKVSECTNISVGYYNQHTKNETQDLDFAESLRDALISADWSKLVFQRDPQDAEYLYYGTQFGYDYSEMSHTDEDRLYDIYDLIRDYPKQVARVLLEMGFSARDLAEEIGTPNYHLDHKEYY